MYQFWVCLFLTAVVFILAGGFIEMYRNHKEKERQKCNDTNTNQ